MKVASILAWLNSSGHAAKDMTLEPQIDQTSGIMCK
jgi:hypothetical protein